MTTITARKYWNTTYGLSLRRLLKGTNTCSLVKIKPIKTNFATKLESPSLNVNKQKFTSSKVNFIMKTGLEVLPGIYVPYNPKISFHGKKECIVGKRIKKIKHSSCNVKQTKNPDKIKKLAKKSIKGGSGYPSKGNVKRSDSDLRFEDVTLVPEYYNWRITPGLTLRDCGSNGYDCLLRVFNYRREQLGLSKLDTESVYAALSKKLGTYLEEDDLVKIANYSQFNCIVVRHSDAEDVIIKYDMGFVSWAYIYNFYPMHYYAVDQVTFRDRQFLLKDINNFLRRYTGSGTSSMATILESNVGKSFKILSKGNLRLKVPIRSFNFLLTEEYEGLPESEAFVVEAEPNLTMNYFRLFYSNSCLLDVEASGNCFLLSLKSATSRLSLIDYSNNLKDTHANLVNLPLQGEIDDAVLVQICKVCHINMFLIRSLDMKMSLINFNYPSTISLIYTDNQYMLSDIFKLNDKLYLFSSFKFEKEKIIAQEKLEEIDELPDVLIEQDTTYHNDPEKDLIEDVDIGYLYGYVNSRYKIKTMNYQLNYSDSKVYYKLRHNMFKTAFLNAVGLNSFEEKPFSRFGIDSVRTPDFLELMGDTLLLIEFTVVKHYQTSLATKKSKSKYSEEVQLLLKRGFKVESFYPVLALDTNCESIVEDLNQISKIMDVELDFEPSAYFTGIIEHLNFLEFNIQELVPEILINVDLDVDDQFNFGVKDFVYPDLFSPIKQKVSIKRQRDQTVFNMIRKNSRSLESSLRKIFFKGKFLIVVNFKLNSVYCDFDNSGISRNRLLSYLQNLSLECLKFVKFIGDKPDDMEPFTLYGDAKLENIKRKQIEDLTFDTSDYENYFANKLIGSNGDLKLNLLADSSLEDQIEKVESTYLRLLENKRKEPNVVIYQKNYFITPCVTLAAKGEFEHLTLKTDLPITDLLLSRIYTVNKSKKTISRNLKVDVMDQLLMVQNGVYKKLVEALNGDYKLARKLKRCRTRAQFDDIIGPEQISNKDYIFEIVIEFSKAKKEVINAVGEDTRTTYQNRICVPNSLMKKSWLEEMEHFRTKKGEIKIHPDQEFSDMEMKIKSLLERLWSHTSNESMDDVYSQTNPMGNELKSLLKEMKAGADEVMSELLETQIMRDLELVSRFAYTLCYLSNIKLNKNDFMYDNLGYKDVLLIVKGGKKIIATKKSRLCKLIFPIEGSFSWLYASSFTKIVTLNGKTYCVLPWQIFKFDMLKKYMELYYSFPNYFTCSYLESNLSLSEFQNFCGTKVLNMYSQRRKLEIWFGSFRYLYLNSMSTHTSVLDLIDSMVDYDYDPYMYFYQRLFAHNYKNIFKYASQSKIFDSLTGLVYDNFDLCAEKFDETLFMTMAPFDRENEHLKNLKSVLNTQYEFQQKYSFEPLEILKQTSVDAHQDDYFSDLFSDDFKFDPKLAFSVGQFAGKYLNKVTNKSEMHEKFAQMLSDSFSIIGTSKGMRSSKGEFWGEKGYDVLFTNDENLQMLKSFIQNLPKSYREFSTYLNSSHQTFIDKISVLSDIVLEFDIKDKAQWKGSREIYVMSDNTKLIQNPVERFFKFLCQMVPNELIHKKSHVRPKFIHSQVYEFLTTEEERTYCTLDCRKWAPKSNLWKYFYFILGMRNHLPDLFWNFFVQLWSLMFKKRIRIQSRYVDILKGNKKTEHLASLLTKIDDDQYYFVMPYSFMMGIFNYLSSFLHAISQLYFNEKISSRQSVTFNLIAHSDDSGGVILSSSYEKNIKVFRQYEIFQKGLNHLLSRKKSALSSKYFEIISIMYADQRLIPMTHKFLANVSFEPKGKGWFDDICSVISKIVELFSNGATMRQCYYTMLCMDEMIRKFYHLPRLTTLSQVPIAFGGVFNMHPLHLILLGSDCQEVMLDLIEKKTVRDFRIKTYINLTGDYFPGKGNNVNYRIPYYKSHKFTGEFTSEELTDMSIISSCLTKTTLGDVMGHYSRLKNQSYVYSLTGVDMCQIFVMTLYTKTMIMKGEEKTCDMRRFTTLYATMNALELTTESLDYKKSFFHNYIKASESIKIKLSDINVPSTKTCKPITYHTFENIGLGLNFKSISEIIAYNENEKFSFLFPDKFKMEALTQWVKNNLSQPNLENVNSYLQKLTNKDTERIRSSYCFLPSNISVDTLERFWTYINFYCTKRYFISSKAPQYFTVDQFKLWTEDFEELKHYYLLLKLAFSVDISQIKMLKENVNCKTCTYTENLKHVLEEVERIRLLSDYSTFTTDLPYAIYKTSQMRNVNVWYGGVEFDLVTQFGNVKVRRREGKYTYDCTIISDEFLDKLIFLLKNFLVSRGLSFPTPEYNINDTGKLVLTFGDLNQPLVAEQSYRGMLVKDFTIRYQEYVMQRLLKDNDNYFIDGEKVDFEVYFNYDLNPKFYQLHGLEYIDDLIFPNTVELSLDTFKNSVLASRLYKVIRCDPFHDHFGNLEEKYQNMGLLGSEGSFTRALAMADQQGLTEYRSSVNPRVLDVSLLEGTSHKDVPILDLIDNFSFLRMTYNERFTIDKIVNGRDLNSEDKYNLDKLISKLGIKPTFSSIAVYKIIISNMVYDDVHLIPVEVLKGFLLSLIKSALNSIENIPKRKKDQQQIQGNKQEIALAIYVLFKFKFRRETIAEYLVKLFFRAHNDSAVTFWNLRKDNLYAALFTPDRKKMNSQYKLILSTVSTIKLDLLKEILSIRQVILASKNFKTLIDNFQETVEEYEEELEDHDYALTGVPDLKELSTMNYYLTGEEEDLEEFLDYIQGGEDPEEFEEREWEGEESAYFITSQKVFNVVCENTLLKEYGSVKIYTLSPEVYMPWLGRYDVKFERKYGLLWYVREYPGNGPKLLSINDELSVESIRKVSKPIVFEEEPKKVIKNFQARGKDIFNLGSSEEIYDYQVELLESIGIKNPHMYSNFFFKKSELTSPDLFWSNFMTGLNLKAFIKKEEHTSKPKRTNVLPGFTGYLKDEKMKAELSCIFKDHAEEILTGNQALNAKTYKFIIKAFRRLYNNVDKESKAIIIILLSTMKDCVISENSDSWYSDILIQFLDDLDNNESADMSMSAPPAIEAEIQYKKRRIYEGYL